MKMASVLFIVFTTLCGCATEGPKWWSPQVHRAATEEQVSKREAAAAGYQLNESYLRHEQARLESGAGVQEPLRPLAVPNGATIIFRNNDNLTVQVTIREVSTPREIGDAWNVVIAPGETFVYPRDDIRAPHFKVNATYAVVWWRERPDASYSRTPRQYSAPMVVGPKPNWSTKDQLWYFALFEFRPAPLYE